MLRQYGEFAQSVQQGMRYFSCYTPQPIGDMVDAWSRYASFVGLEYKEPLWNIEDCRVNGESIPIDIRTVYETPFMRLQHFSKVPAAHKQPSVLLMSPMSGHFPTLLRETVRTFLPDFDVYITGWKDARGISPEDGRFGVDEYIDHLVASIQAIPDPCHAVAVCQPAPLAMVAAAVLAQGQNKEYERLLSMTLIGGPVDPENPASEPTRFAQSHSLDWFRRYTISDIPSGYGGAGRKVYPGFVQLSAFIMMDPTRHGWAYKDYFTKLVEGDNDLADNHEKFYREYLAVSDTCEEFYIETIDRIFQKNLIGRNCYRYHGRAIDLKAISYPHLWIVEGEKDEIAPPGQTSAALRLCGGLAESRKGGHLAKGVGHYGVFSGRRFRKSIYPGIAATIRNAEREYGKV